MRHAVKGKQLNRDTSNRRALFKNLMLALIEHGRIETTEAKAKAMRSEFEKLLTRAKSGTIHDRRIIDGTLNQREAVNTMVDEIAPAVKRTSGYTRITKLGNRRGDDAMMVRLEILDWQPKAGNATAADAKAKADKPASQGKTEDAKVSAHAPAAKEAVPTKVKQPAKTTGAVKRMPQKRIAGGGK